MGWNDGLGGSPDMRKPRVLVSAYGCEPNKGSEPGVGWNWAKQIAKYYDVWVITRANNRESIENEFQLYPDSNLHFTYYDVPRWLSFWKKKTRGLYLYYLLWQIGAYYVARRLHLREKFDLVHHITFGNLWLPTFMPFLPIPFVWGPIGGGEQVPRAFRKEYPIGAKVQELIRDIILASLKVNPLFLFACKRAKAIIARTEESARKIPFPYRKKVTIMLETGAHSTDFPARANSANGDFLQVVSVGRLIHLKGFDLAIRAFAETFKVKDNARLLIIGEGPDRDRLQRICRDRDISDKVSFAGRLSHEQTVRHMTESSLFLFPSLKEGGAWVLFEAMLLGLPVICMDIAGPGKVVTDTCGIKVEPSSPEQTVTDLSKALSLLAADSELRRMLGQEGKRRIKAEFAWDRKGEFIMGLYERIRCNQ
jgi:glycosyltransferase involved in cell wall biosynthesis